MPFLLLSGRFFFFWVRKHSACACRLMAHTSLHLLDLVQTQPSHVNTSSINWVTIQDWMSGKLECVNKDHCWNEDQRARFLDLCEMLGFPHLLIKVGVSDNLNNGMALDHCSRLLQDRESYISAQMLRPYLHEARRIVGSSTQPKACYSSFTACEPSEFSPCAHSRSCAFLQLLSEKDEFYSGDTSKPERKFVLGSELREFWMQEEIAQAAATGRLVSAVEGNSSAGSAAAMLWHSQFGSLCQFFHDAGHWDDVARCFAYAARVLSPLSARGGARSLSPDASTCDRKQQPRVKPEPFFWPIFDHLKTHTQRRKMSQAHSYYGIACSLKHVCYQRSGDGKAGKLVIVGNHLRTAVSECITAWTGTNSSDSLPILGGMDLDFVDEPKTDEAPYIMGTTLLAAMDDGLDNSLDPGEPEERNIYEAMAEGKEVKKLPMSLGEALDHLAGNEVIKRGMPGEMYRLYDEYKRDEFARFMSTVTEWDNETYMECLP